MEWIEKIEQKMDSGDFQKAVQLAQKVSSEDPNFFKALQLKALSFQKLRKWEEAMECWDFLILRIGDVADFYSERGVCKFNLEFKSAIEDFNKAVELEPDNGYRYSSRAYVLDRLGKIPQAIDDYSKAIELDPEDSISINNLGITEQKRGRTKRASDLFEKADALLDVEKRIMPTEEIKVEEEPEQTAERPTSTWSEVKKMVSSPSEFKRFISEAFGLFKK